MHVLKQVTDTRLLNHFYCLLSKKFKWKLGTLFYKPYSYIHMAPKNWNSFHANSSEQSLARHIPCHPSHLLSPTPQIHNFPKSIWKDNWNRRTKLHNLSGIYCHIREKTVTLRSQVSERLFQTFHRKPLIDDPISQPFFLRHIKWVPKKTKYSLAVLHGGFSICNTVFKHLSKNKESDIVFCLFY